MLRVSSSCICRLSRSAGSYAVASSVSRQRIRSIAVTSARSISSSCTSWSPSPSPVLSEPAAKRAPTTNAVETSDMTDVSPEALKMIAEKDLELRAAYDAMPESYPDHALPSEHTNAASSTDSFTTTDAYRKRLIYRSKQRGWYVRVR